MVQYLEDTETSACFAAMPSLCMTYRDCDKVGEPHQNVIQVCHGKMERYCDSFLETMINLHSESHTKLPLQRETRIRLHEGFLEMRNRALAFHGDTTPWNRFDELRACTVEGRKRYVHQELFDANRASNYTLPLCIMDNPKRPGRSVALELRYLQ